MIENEFSFWSRDADAQMGGFIPSSFPGCQVVYDRLLLQRLDMQRSWKLLAGPETTIYIRQIDITSFEPGLHVEATFSES